MGILKEIINSLFHPEEITSMFQVKYGGYIRKTYSEPLEELSKTLDDLDFCYAVLNRVSRSFAVVIQQLPERLKDPVCIFYLVLRGLDSVEDDMDYPLKEKIPLLNAFHEKLHVDGWKIEGVGDSPDYRVLMAHFDKVINVFKSLEKKYQDPIVDITKRMGAGMAEFAEKAVCNTCKEYDLYCHYVAGLVGFGLSDLFSVCGLENPKLKDMHKLSNSMGLFLQKTNIIRDYREDIEETRTWWPKEIWSNYASELTHFKNNPDSEKSLACLNHMVTDALQHIPDVLEYLRMIKDPQIFRFTAIPQVMAVATLATVYNNHEVFRRVVKIRKGLSCKMMLHTNNMHVVNDIFRKFALDIRSRIPPRDPSASTTFERVNKALELARVQLPRGILRFTNFLAWILLLVASFFLLTRYKERHSHGVQPAGGIMSAGDLSAVLVACSCVAYLFGFFGMSFV